MTVTLETLALQIEVNHQELTAGLNRANKKVDNFAKKTTNSFRLLKVAAIGVFGSQFLRATINAASSIQQLEFRLKSSTGSATAAAEAMSFLTDTANKQGVGIIDLADGYVRLLPSVKSGAISMNEMRDILRLTNDNMKAFGVSATDAKRIFFGLSQLLGSGIVTMENLKQVTEHLPGSLNALADATNRSLGELIDWVSTGKVTAEMLKGPLLEAFRKNEGAAEDMADTYVSAVTRMQNAGLELADAIGDAGLTGAMSNAADNTAWFTRKLTALVKEVDEFLKKMEEGKQANLEFFEEQRKEEKKSNFAKMLGFESTEDMQTTIDMLNNLPKPADLFIGPKEMIGPRQPRAFAPSPVLRDEDDPTTGRQKILDDLKELEDEKLEVIRKAEEKRQEIIDSSQGMLHSKNVKFLKILQNEEKISGVDRVNILTSAFGSMLGEAAKHNKAFFEINKAAGIANAVISTAQGVSKALELPFPLNLAAAAVVGAAGAAQIATIASTSFSGGGRGGGGGGASAATPSIAQASEATGGGGDRGLNIAISGVDRDASFTGKQVRELIGALNEAAEDGAVIKGVSIV